MEGKIIVTASKKTNSRILREVKWQGFQFDPTRFSYHKNNKTAMTRDLKIQRE